MHARSNTDPRVRTRLAPVFALVLLAAACGTTATPSPSPTASPTLTPTLTPTRLPSPTPAPEFPVTVTDDEGTSVTIPHEPSTIVSLTPAATEILFALGIGERVEGKAFDQFLYPPEAGAIPDLTTAESLAPDLERIVAQGTDLVIAGGLGFTPPDSIARLRELGIPVIVVYARDLETVYADVELIGRVTGRTNAAQLVADRMQAGMAEVSAAASGQAAPRVFYETGTDDSGTVYGVADDSFLAEMIELAGGTPVTTGSAESFAMPVERLIVEDPEVILLSDAAYGVTAEQVVARPGWDVITAVKNAEIRPIDDQTVTRPGPRLFLGLALLAKTIHPDATIPDPSPIPAVP